MISHPSGLAGGARPADGVRSKAFLALASHPSTDSGQNTAAMRRLASTDSCARWSTTRQRRSVAPSRTVRGAAGRDGGRADGAVRIFTACPRSPSNAPGSRGRNRGVPPGKGVNHWSAGVPPSSSSPAPSSSPAASRASSTRSQASSRRGPDGRAPDAVGYLRSRGGAMLGRAPIMGPRATSITRNHNERSNPQATGRTHLPGARSVSPRAENRSAAQDRGRVRFSEVVSRPSIARSSQWARQRPAWSRSANCPSPWRVGGVSSIASHPPSAAANPSAI